MVFLGIYRAVYDYAPQGENELEISEGDLLFVLEKSTVDAWWKAKKKALSDDDDEPEGLIPNNYVEEAEPVYKAKALYDYTKQTDEELSFSEDATLDVYDITDPDWTLVGRDGEYGFAPAIYIEEASKASAANTTPAAPAMPARPQYPQPEPEPEYEEDSPLASPAAHNPAAALAGIIAQRTGTSTADRGFASPPLPSRPQYTPDASDEEEPAAPILPRRPQSQNTSPIVTQYASARRETETVAGLPSPPYNRAHARDYDDDQGLRSPAAGFHMYNVSEMLSHMGKKKKMPTVLGINVARGVITISPEKSRDGPSQEWTAEKLSHYSIEGKHVFMELIRPSKSIDFHAGAKDTASEIVAALGEMAGAARAEGLREVLAATSGTGQKTGHMLYEFMAQGEDEVTVAVGDEVIVLDDTKSEEWWMVRRLRNGKEGVVPSSYVEITGSVPAPTPSYSGVNAGRSTVDQNRLEEERLTREIAKSHNRRDSEPNAEVGRGLQLPDRHSSLVQNGDNNQSSQKGKRDVSDSKSKPKPNSSKVRTWTDRSGSFKVDAEFIGLKDGKIHLHKLNGVKIAVPVTKMAIEDLEYVENATGVSLDEDKPLSDIKRRSTQRNKERGASVARTNGAGASVQQTPEYDWFDFFLQAGVNPQICERYAAAFTRDQMGAENFADIQPPLLRTLGLKEGDILRVMKLLDAKLGRTRDADADANDVVASNGSAGGLFSGPGGALRNNTRKGRPAPAMQTNDVVDADAFKQDESERRPRPVDAAPLNSLPAKSAASGFDDDAWDVKPSRSASISAPAPASAPVPAPAPQLVEAPPAPPPVKPALTGGMSELSLLSTPLQPTPAPQSAISAPPAQALQSTRTGADPLFFDQLAAPAPLQNLQQQQTGAPRQRPQAPQQMQSGSMIGHPPARAASAPGLQPQPTGFLPSPLQPQMTGYQGPPGQTLQDLEQQRMMQQQYGQQALQPQMTGYMQQQQQQQPYNPVANGMAPQATGFGQPQQMPQQTGYAQFQQPQQTGFQPSLQQQFMIGQTTGSPFADPPRAPFQPQPTGLQQTFSLPPYLQSQQTGYMQPQQTGFMQPQQTGMNGFGQQPQSNGFGQPPAPQQQQFGQQGFGSMQPMQSQPTGLQPLVAQKTGPAPNIRFGMQPASKLTPQPTGRANLRNATPQNPFGF